MPVFIDNATDAVTLLILSAIGISLPLDGDMISQHPNRGVLSFFFKYIKVKLSRNADLRIFYVILFFCLFVSFC